MTGSDRRAGKCADADGDGEWLTAPGAMRESAG